MTSEFLIHCSYCGFNFESESRRKDQQCPECSHRASGGEPIDKSKHQAGIKTNYKGTPMDETENTVP
jgi:hypothetical protein